MKVVSLWSGGKDSCFACYKAVSTGYNVTALFNFINSNGRKSVSHGLPAKLISQQAELTGIPILQKAMPKKTYRREFINLIAGWKEEKGIEGIVFGDIYLQEHKDWLDKVSQESKVKAIFPLWKKDTKKLIEEFVRLGFEAVIVTAKSGVLTKDWLGRKIDKQFTKILKPGIDPCGEQGEFHTFVTNGPLFKKQIEITKSKEKFKDGRWFLNILDWKTKPKKGNE